MDKYNKATELADNRSFKEAESLIESAESSLKLYNSKFKPPPS